LTGHTLGCASRSDCDLITFNQQDGLGQSNSKPAASKQ
jgi:hypothetical protein